MYALARPLRSGAVFEETSWGAAINAPIHTSNPAGSKPQTPFPLGTLDAADNIFLPHPSPNCYYFQAVIPARSYTMTSHSEFGERTPGSEVTKVFADQIGGKTSQ